jgi:hypothetical protein
MIHVLVIGTEQELEEKARASQTDGKTQDGLLLLIKFHDPRSKTCSQRYQFLKAHCRLDWRQMATVHLSIRHHHIL